MPGLPFIEIMVVLSSRVLIFTMLLAPPRVMSGARELYQDEATPQRHKSHDPSHMDTGSSSLWQLPLTEIYLNSKANIPKTERADRAWHTAPFLPGAPSCPWRTWPGASAPPEHGKRETSPGVTLKSPQGCREDAALAGVGCEFNVGT